MASKGNFFSKVLSFILVLIIISGVGFLGYNLISGGAMTGMSGMNMSANNNSTGDTAKSTDSSSSNNQMNMSNSSSNQGTMNTGGNESNAQYATGVANNVLQNKDNLEKTIGTLNDALKLMTVDPYGVAVNNGQASNQSTTQSQEKNAQSSTTTQGSTVVNVYPQNSTAQSQAMQNMGATYDANKMQQLHTGLYKLSVGVQLLDQLKGNLSFQLEQASMEVKNSSQYYYNQYLLTVQNKEKLTQALSYINEASTLINTNPYVSQNGSIYDKDRMKQLHESIYKFGEVVVALNKINDNFSTQSISLSNQVNNAQSMTGTSNMTSMDNMNNNVFSNIFGNLSIATVFNILVIVFIVIFIVSILGYINRLLKSPKHIE